MKEKKNKTYLALRRVYLTCLKSTVLVVGRVGVVVKVIDKKNCY